MFCLEKARECLLMGGLSFMGEAMAVRRVFDGLRAFARRRPRALPGSSQVVRGRANRVQLSRDPEYRASRAAGRSAASDHPPRGRMTALSNDSMTTIDYLPGRARAGGSSGDIATVPAAVLGRGGGRRAASGFAWLG